MLRDLKELNFTVCEEKNGSHLGDFCEAGYFTPLNKNRQEINRFSLRKCKSYFLTIPNILISLKMCVRGSVKHNLKAYLAAVFALFSSFPLSAQMQTEAFKSAQLHTKSVHHPAVALTKTSSFDRFPKEWCALRELKTKIKKLQANKHKMGELLVNKIRKRAKTDPAILAKTTHDALKPENKKIASRYNPPFDYNRTGRNLNFFINASDVNTDIQNFILSELPHTISEAQNYLEAIIKQGTKVFISLHETNEDRERCHDFWKDSSTQQFKFSDGSKIVNSKTKVLLTGKKGVKNISQIVETKLLLTNGKTITHLHYDGWYDRTPVPDEHIFQALLNRVKELSPRKEIPIAINCRGGVGRTGVTAICYSLRSQIEEQLAKGKNLDDIEINIPETLYALRKQRSGLVQKTKQFTQVYAIIGGYYEQLKSQK